MKNFSLQLSRVPSSLGSPAQRSGARRALQHLAHNRRKAVNELQILGLVSRRAGSGTHVLGRAVSAGRVFGLLIPDLGRTEIFEPICHGMMQSPLSKPHSLL
jgi:hypothetical protein